MQSAIKHLTILAAIITILSSSTYAFAEDNVADLFEESFGHETEGNYKTALNKVLKILQRDTKNYTAYLRAGWLAYMQGSNEQAVEYYKKAITLNPAAIEAKLGISLPYIGLSDWKSAESAVRDVMKGDPANYYANSRLAWILYSQGRYSEALKTYQKVHEWYPSDIEMMLGMGWTYFKLGKMDQARTYFQKVLEIRQSNVRALQGINALENQ